MAAGEDKAKAGWPDVLKAAIWPLFALAVIALFFSPIRQVLETTGRSGRALDELKVGPLQVKLSPTAAAKLPVPDAGLAKALAALTAADIKILIEYPDEVMSTEFCLKPPPLGDPGWGRLSDDFARGRIHDAERFRAMIGLGLFAAEQQRGDGFSCPVDGWAAVSWTEDGKAAKKFLIDLAANAVQLSTE